ncbi:MAG: hypothetical protein ACLGH7_03590, partial [Actinomycetes bacterium]
LQFQELLEAVREANRDDGAEAVIIAGGPLSGTARRLAAAGAAEIVQPVPSACAMVLDLLERRPRRAHGKTADSTLAT